MRVIFQLDEMDCGPACIAMIASFLGKNYSVQHIREQSYLTREGVSIQGIKEACSAIGLDSRSYFLSYEELILLEDNYFPCILHWNQNHFVVLNRNIHSRRFLFFKRKKFGIADPAHGYVKLSEEAFKESWVTQNGKGIAIFMQKTPDFVQREPIKSVEIGISYFFKYLQPYKKLIFVLFFLLFIGSGLTILFPFLTQYLIDSGVNAKNLNVVAIILIAQLAVYFGSITVEIVRNWVMLYLGTKLSIGIISDFLKKLVELPMKFFETKMIGDLHQRIEDNERIESFLTSQSLLTFFHCLILLFFLLFFGIMMDELYLLTPY